MVYSELSTLQCAQIWSDNLQLPYASKLEVIWDQTTSDLIGPTSNFLTNTTIIEIFQAGHLWRHLATLDRNTRDRSDRTRTGKIDWTDRTTPAFVTEWFMTGRTGKTKLTKLNLTFHEICDVFHMDHHWYSLPSSYVPRCLTVWSFQ